MWTVAVRTIQVLNVWRDAGYFGRGESMREVGLREDEVEMVDVEQAVR